MEVAEIDAEEQGLRDLGIQQDVTEDRPIPPSVSAEEKASARTAGEAKPTETPPPATGEPEGKPVSSEIEPITEKQPQTGPQKDPVTGKFVKQEQQQATGEELTREQKEAERKDRSWQRLEAEKQVLRQQQAEWEERTRLTQLDAARNIQPLQKEGLDAKGYFQGYQMFKKSGHQALQEGDPSSATQHFGNALRSLETVMELQQQEASRQAQRDQAQVEYGWRKDMEQVMQHVPDLKAGTPLAQKVDELVANNPWLYYIPHGFVRAVEVADMLLKMDSFSELQEELDQLRAFKEKHLAKSQPTNGSSPGGRGGAKSLDDMSLDEGESYLRGVTERADAEARY